jgi:hypothetical protein
MGVSKNNRRARFHRITKAGRTQLESQLSQWAAAGIVAPVIALKGAKA